MSVTVLLIPHAGGMASSYFEFTKFADSLVDFRFVELAGRGTRIGESLYNDFEEAACDIFNQNIDLFQEGNYVLLGHSMGSWLAYELYYKIYNARLPLPLHIFFSGNVSPYTTKRTCFSAMDDDEFIGHILKNEQTSEEVFKNPELRSIFLPVLRADYHILEKYKPSEGREPIACNISVLCGLKDPIFLNCNVGWEELTYRECEITYFEGSHFFIFECLYEVFDYIYRTIEMCNNM